MKVTGIILVLIFLAGCTSQQKTATLIGINIHKDQCELIENGSGYKENYVKFEGRVWKRDGQHYGCAVEIPEKEFKEKLGYTCVLRGFNRTSSYFYTGEATSLRKQSCSFYQLRKGPFIFNASGISSDSCYWTCV